MNHIQHYSTGAVIWHITNRIQGLLYCIQEFLGNRFINITSQNTQRNNWFHMNHLYT